MPPWSDLLVLFAIASSTPWWVYRLRRRGIRGRALAASGTVGFLGLVAAGVWLLRVSLGFAAPTGDAPGRALLAIFVVLALVVPLIPIQAFFAIPLTIIGGTAFLLVLWYPPTAAGAREPTVAFAHRAPERVGD